MKVELFLVLLIFLILFFWAVWFKISTKRLRKKYDKNPNEEKSKYGKELWGKQGVVSERRESDIAKANKRSSGLSEPEGRRLLPTADADSLRENGKRSGKTARRRNPFRRRR